MVWDWVNYVNLHSDPGETNRTDPTVCQVTSAPLTAHLVLTWRTSQPEVRKGGKRCSKNPPPRRQNCSKNGTLASLTNVFVVSHCCFDILRFFFQERLQTLKSTMFLLLLGMSKKVRYAWLSPLILRFCICLCCQPVLHRDFCDFNGASKKQLSRTMMVPPSTHCIPDVLANSVVVFFHVCQISWNMFEQKR